ncbi:ATP-dependent DNA helicase Q1, partial [Paramuricea clavata]
MADIFVSALQNMSLKFKIAELKEYQKLAIRKFVLEVNHLNCLGIRAVNLSNVKNEEERIMVEHGAFSIVYGTPEAWLKNERWREMLHNSVYSEKLCAIAIDEAHVLKQ